jgi:hypothetical protein
MSKLTKAAEGRDCQIRIPGVCNFNPYTTVLAHYRLAGTCGTGIKPDDAQGAWACSSCHDAIDGRIKKNMTVKPCVCTTPRAYFARKQF